MSGVGTGVLMDEAALFFNPGTVSFLKQNGVQGGVSPIFLKAAVNEFGFQRGGATVNKLVESGADVSSAFITGNLYSLDGIHLTPLDYAITANGFIKAINSQYGSSIPIVEVSTFEGVKFP